MKIQKKTQYRFLPITHEFTFWIIFERKNLPVFLNKSSKFKIIFFLFQILVTPTAAEIVDTFLAADNEPVLDSESFFCCIHSVATLKRGFVRP